MNESNQEILNSLEKALIDHDWFYFTSDSNRTYQEGKASQSNINYLMSSARCSGLTDQAEALYLKYYKLNQFQRYS